MSGQTNSSVTFVDTLLFADFRRSSEIFLRSCVGGFFVLFDSWYLSSVRYIKFAPCNKTTTPFAHVCTHMCTVVDLKNENEFLISAFFWGHFSSVPVLPFQQSCKLLFNGAHTEKKSSKLSNVDIFLAFVLVSCASQRKRCKRMSCVWTRVNFFSVFDVFCWWFFFSSSS